jgi:excisionase family DNA binding protein
MVSKTYTAREVAELFKVHTKTVYLWYKIGKLPGFKVGDKILRFNEDDVNKFQEVS